MNSADRLREIQDEMATLLEEAKDLVRKQNKFAWERARSYWVGHISEALGGDYNDYVGKSMCSMEDTIAELDGESDEDEDEDD